MLINSISAIVCKMTIYSLHNDSLHNIGKQFHAKICFLFLHNLFSKLFYYICITQKLYWDKTVFNDKRLKGSHGNWPCMHANAESWNNTIYLKFTCSWPLAMTCFADTFVNIIWLSANKQYSIMYCILKSLTKYCISITEYLLKILNYVHIIIVNIRIYWTI